MEMNALRCAAGYVPSSLFKKLKKSADPLKRELQLCLWDLIDEKEGRTADDWVDAIDRGGLTRVNEMTFQVPVFFEGRNFREFRDIFWHSQRHSQNKK